MTSIKSVIIQVSSSNDGYWGYRYTTTIKASPENEKTIITALKKDMKAFFKKHNLMALVDGIDNLTLHIHFPDDEQTIYYACDVKH